MVKSVAAKALEKKARRKAAATPGAVKKRHNPSAANKGPTRIRRGGPSKNKPKQQPKTAAATVALIKEKAALLKEGKPAPSTAVVVAKKPKGKLAGQSMVFTGHLSMPRGVWESSARAAGAKVTETVNKGTTIVVAGGGAGSKIAQAERMGAEVLNESQFEKRFPFSVSNEDGE